MERFKHCLKGWSFIGFIEYAFMCHIYQRTSTIMQFITMLQKLMPPFLFWRFFFIKWSNSKESNYCCTHGVYQYISNHLHNFRSIFFLFNYNFKENIVWIFEAKPPTQFFLPFKWNNISIIFLIFTHL